MARQLYYRDSYGRVHRDRQAGGRGVTIVVYGRMEIRLEESCIASRCCRG